MRIHLVLLALAIPGLSVASAGMAQPAAAQMTPSAPATLIAQTTDVSTTAQTLVSVLASGDYVAARNLYDSANTSVTSETIRQNWSDVIAQYGDYQQQTGTRTVPLENPEGGTMAIVTVQFANGNSNLYIVFNAQGEAVSFDVVQE